ncbi:MAG: YybH family protein [Candidatus Binataceae bacterium]
MNDEQAIREVEERIRTAIGAGDVNGIVNCYIADESLVVFDDVLPLKIAGGAGWRKTWQEAFTLMPGKWDVGLKEMGVTCGGDVGFTWSIVQISVANPNGPNVDGTFRLTQGYRKIGGRWLVTHSHLSLPLDPQTWTAVFNAT